MQKIGAMASFWVCFAKKAIETRPLRGVKVGFACSWKASKQVEALEEMEPRPYRPVLSTRQAGMPTLLECRGGQGPLGEMLQGKAGEVKTSKFYETKPASLLEST